MPSRRAGEATELGRNAFWKGFEVAHDPWGSRLHRGDQDARKSIADVVQRTPGRGRQLVHLFNAREGILCGMLQRDVDLDQRVICNRLTRQMGIDDVRGGYADDGHAG
jgi:hypothetical protein